MEKSVLLLLILLLLGPWAMAANAESVAREDLATAKLPHSDVFLPIRQSPEGRDGYIYRFNDQAWGKIPAGVLNARPRRSEQETLQALRQENAGDLLYAEEGGGSFVAISGKIQDLGQHELADLSGQTLKSPVTTGKDQLDIGMIREVKEGHVFLVQTLAGKYALVRILEKYNGGGKIGAKIQYVYQPDGSLVFKMGTVMAAAPRLPTTSPSTMPRPETNFDARPIDTFCIERNNIILTLIERVKRKPSTPALSLAKLNAIESLGKLRAESAVPFIFDEIYFTVNSQTQTHPKPLVVEELPAVKSLIQIGKPASREAMRRLATYKLGPAPQRPNDTFNLEPIVVVLKGVEGPDVANFLLQEALHQSPANRKEVYRVALDLLKAKP